MKIGIVDYESGNLFNISLAIEKAVGHKPICVNSPDLIRTYDGLVLPGVGAFPEGMQAVKKKSFDGAIREFAKSGKPLLGVCLGMQLMCESSEEFGHTSGLGLVSGSCGLLSATSAKVPQISWNTVHSPVDRKNLGWFYFVHSYGVKTDTCQDIFGLAEHGGDEFVAMVRRENILGCQFHPERSGKDGLELLRKFFLESL